MFGNLINLSLWKNFVSFPFEHDNTFSKKLYFTKPLNKAVAVSANSKNRTGFIWINNPHYNKNFSELAYCLNNISGRKPVFVSCCNTEMADYFSGNKYEIIKVGKEAIINLNENHFSGQRLKESIRAGLRHGTVREYAYSKYNANRLEQFKAISKHGKEPQLKYFFNDKFTPGNRLFVHEDNSGGWLGVLLLYKVDNKIIKTDLILRRNNAPNGVMEALIYEVFADLKNEGYKTWSLGEVPYVVYDSKLFSKEYMINKLGRSMKFAYNYSGLYKFKDKFNPVWNDVFICSNRRLNMLFLFKIIMKSHLLYLVLQKTFSRIFLFDFS